MLVVDLLGLNAIECNKCVDIDDMAYTQPLQRMLLCSKAQTHAIHTIPDSLPVRIAPSSDRVGH